MPDSPRDQVSAAAALAETRDLKAHVAQLIQSLETATGVIRVEKQTTRRYRMNAMGLGVILTVVLSGFALVYHRQGVSNDRIGRVIAHTDECLFPSDPPDPNSCFARLAKRGVQGSVRNADYQACWAAVLPEQRVPRTFEDCKRKVFPEAFK